MCLCKLIFLDNYITRRDLEEVLNKFKNELKNEIKQLKNGTQFFSMTHVSFIVMCMSVRVYMRRGYDLMNLMSVLIYFQQIFQ
jgi:hypothetical protein